MKRKIAIASLVMITLIIACRNEVDDVVAPGPDPVSPVVFDPDHVPYDSLSTYRFFQGHMADLQPAVGVLPYDLITPLFSDYALKKRFLWMPSGVRANYVSDGRVLDFPDGTILIKNFYYEHVQPTDATRIIETRLLIKRYGQWVFADYVWNNDQTEATLDLNGHYTPLDWTDAASVSHHVNYRVPAAAECFTCHKSDGVPMPIGPKPQNLHTVFPYPSGAMDQLAKWAEVGYLNGNYPSNIQTLARWDDPAQDLTLRVRSYLDVNCSHCHSDEGHCDYRPMRFAFGLSADPVNLGVCVPPEDQFLPQLDHIVSAGSTDSSMLYYRFNATDEAVRMPLLGRTVRHEEAVLMIQEWINSLSPPCN